MREEVLDERRTLHGTSSRTDAAIARGPVSLAMPLVHLDRDQDSANLSFDRRFSRAPSHRPNPLSVTSVFDKFSDSSPLSPFRCSSPWSVIFVFARSLRFDDEILELVSSALRQSHADESRFHDEAIKRLQTEYTRLQNRIDHMYVDKLDGRVTAEFFDQKSAKWRQEQAAIRQNLEQHENANQSLPAGRRRHSRTGQPGGGTV